MSDLEKILWADSLFPGSHGVKITLNNGMILSGEGWDVHEATDDNGDGLGFDILTFKPDDQQHLISLQENQIKSWEPIKPPTT